MTVERTGRTALVVEGGAMRGIFATGVMDAFMEEKFNPFDLYIGVSAGSTALAAYVAGMYQRNYKIFTTYSIGEDFISWKKFFRGGHLVDLDWLWEVTIRDLRLDLEKICLGNHEFLVGVTDAKTGKAVFLRPEMHNLEEVTKASSALPILYRNQVEVEGHVYVDGGLAAPIPVEEAFRRGADKIVVLRSRPKSFEMKPKRINQVFSQSFLKDYPAVIEATADRPMVYAKSLAFMRRPPSRISILEVNPPEEFKTKRLTKDLKQLNEDYELGRAAGKQAILDFQNL